MDAEDGRADYSHVCGEAAAGWSERFSFETLEKEIAFGLWDFFGNVTIVNERNRSHPL